MSKKMPPYLQSYTNKKKICIICEGYEEEYYIKRLIQLKVWNPIYDIKIINAKSNSNIFSIFQNTYQSGFNEFIFIICDTDKKPFTQFTELSERINKFFNKKYASEEIIVYSNPCIMQVIISHWCDDILKSQKNIKALQ